MGRAKQMQIEIEERGFSVPCDKHVCAKLFRGHRFIIDYIGEHGVLGCCDYTHKPTQVVPLEDVVAFIMPRFRSYFEDPAEECSYESGGDDEEWEGSGFHKEYGYILPNSRAIFSTREALCELGLELGNETLFEDIASSFINDSWVLVDPYGNTVDEELQWTWEQFAKDVINSKKQGIEDDVILQQHKNRLDDIVCEIRRNLSELIEVLPTGKLLYRCVYYNTLPKSITASNIWAPPADKASSQRMSREGQSRFYASFDKETPLLEAQTSGDEIGLLGMFQFVEDTNVLDLTNLPFRSFMDVEDFFSWRFLQQFTNYIAQPVPANERYEYVPTQIMRDVFENNIPEIQGIMYRSCKDESKTNVVMFWDNHSCAHHINLNSYKVIK